MNCLEFRKEIRSGEELHPQLETHLAGCAECARWLEEATRAAPAGLLPPILEQPSPTLLEPLLPRERPPFLERLFRPLGGALALAGALALLFWVAQPIPSTLPIDPGSLQEVAADLETIRFLEPLEVSVTDPEIEATKDWSFIEQYEPELTFLDDEKEEPWLEESQG